jgi:hypothetical protein
MIIPFVFLGFVIGVVLYLPLTMAEAWVLLFAFGLREPINPDIAFFVGLGAWGLIFAVLSWMNGFRFDGFEATLLGVPWPALTINYTLTSHLH